MGHNPHWLTKGLNVYVYLVIGYIPHNRGDHKTLTSDTRYTAQIRGDPQHIFNFIE